MFANYFLYFYKQNSNITSRIFNPKINHTFQKIIKLLYTIFIIFIFKWIIFSIGKKHNGLNWIIVAFFKCFYCLLSITFCMVHNHLYIFCWNSCLIIIINFFFFFLFYFNFFWLSIFLSMKMNNIKKKKNYNG